MKLIIERKLSNEESKKNSYSSELILNFDDNNCSYEYKRKFLDTEKENFEKKGNFYMQISSYNHLLETLRRINMSKKYNIKSKEIELTLNNCINYIYLTINGKYFKINTSDLEYELLIHLTNFDIFDKVSINEINSLFY